MNAVRHLHPGWFASVMGLSGLSLAWWRAQPLLGDGAAGAALVFGGLAALAFVVLAALSLVRLQRWPEAVREDIAHPVRHVFFAAMPISLVLVATVLTALTGPGTLARVLWMIGSAAQFGVTVWVVSRWLGPKPQRGLAWPGVTPALLIPIVGNVVPALAGVELGMAPWSAAQFGVGVVFWPVVTVLIFVRLGLEGLWPQRLLATTFITVAPPSVIGLGLLQFGAPLPLVLATWGLALFFLLWSFSIGRELVAQPFAIPFWSLSFPLAAFSALTLRLAADAPLPMRLFALAALAFTSLVVLGLAWATVRGLLRGEVLVPEPAPPAKPAT